MSLSGQVAKQIIIHPYHRILFSNKKEWIIDKTSPEMTSEEKKILKDYMLCYYIYATFLKRQNFRNGHRLVIIRG
jgi:hypothetical protein